MKEATYARRTLSLADLRRRADRAAEGFPSVVAVTQWELALLVGIAEAAYAIEQERLHHLDTQCCDCGCHRPAVLGRKALPDMLAQVKP